MRRFSVSAMIASGIAWIAAFAPPPPIKITTTALPLGETNTPYSAPLSATGGKLPYRWGTSGLPDGLSVSGSSLIGSVPVIAQVSVTIAVRDKTGKTASVVLPLRVCAPLQVLPLPVIEYTPGVPVSVQLTAVGGVDITTTPPTCLPGAPAL